MSPKIPVPPLSILSLRYIINILIHLLSDDIGLYYESVEIYLLDATYEVLQDLLKNILNTENLDASTRFSCLEVLLRADVRRLDTGVFPHSYYSKILHVINKKGAGIEYLNLKGVWLHDYTDALSEILHRIKNLKVLIIPHVADDLVLNSVNFCEKLNTLDISGECCFTSKGILELKSESLSVLSIGCYGKKEIISDDENSTEILATLIRNLPNLTILKTYSFTGRSLLSLYEENRNFKTKLKYIHDTETDEEIFDAICHVAPLLENINFNSPKDEVVKKLYLLSYLTNIKLSRANYKSLKESMSYAPNQLKVINLNVFREQSVDVSEINSLAPDVISLDFFKLKLICLSHDMYFMSLKSLQIFNCNVSDSVLRFFLMNCPLLERVAVGDAINMTDGDVFRICAECDFQCLEELRLSCAKGLTSTSVELLMGHCPNLKILGNLSGWDITFSDVEYLQTVIISSNTDLTLLLGDNMSVVF